MKRTGKKNKMKYLLMILCFLSVILGTTSARYVTELNGAIDSGRTAAFHYEITDALYDKETGVAAKVDVDGSLFDRLKAYLTDDQAINAYEVASDDGGLTIKYLVEYQSEVMLKFFVEVQDFSVSKEIDNKEDLEKDAQSVAVVESLTFTGSLPSGASQGGSGAGSYLLLPPSSGKQVFQCELKIKYGDNNERRTHYAKFKPVITQVD